MKLPALVNANQYCAQLDSNKTQMAVCVSVNLKHARLGKYGIIVNVPVKKFHAISKVAPAPRCGFQISVAVAAELFKHARVP